VAGVLVRLPLPLMTIVVAILALVVELLGLAAGLGRWSLALLVIPGALSAAYLLEYRTLPYEPWRPPVRPTPAPVPTPAPEPDEEFVDPVEEADRLEQQKAPEPPPEGAPEPTPPPESS
jgi:hypothetical protein